MPLRRWQVVVVYATQNGREPKRDVESYRVLMNDTQRLAIGQKLRTLKQWGKVNEFDVSLNPDADLTFADLMQRLEQLESSASAKRRSTPASAATPLKPKLADSPDDVLEVSP